MAKIEWTANFMERLDYYIENASILCSVAC